MTALPSTEASGVPRPTFLRIVSGAGLLTSARVIGDLASAILFIVLSRSFGIEGIGLYAYAFAVAQIAHLAVNFGLVDYTLREYASATAVERARILPNALGIQTAILVVVGGGLWAYLRLTHAEPEAAAIVWILSAYLVLSNFALTLFIPAINAQRMLGPALAELVFRVGGTLVAVALVVALGRGMATSLAALPISAAFLLLAAVAIARRFEPSISLRLGRRSAPVMVRGTTTFAGSSLVDGLLARIGLILLTFFQGTAGAGTLATGLKLVDLGTAPLLFLGVAVYPRLASSFGNDDADLAHISEQFVRLSLVLGALVLWGMVFVVPPTLPFLLGPEFTAAAPVVRLMGVVAMLTALDLAAARLLGSLRLQGQRLRIQIIGLVTSVGANLVLIPWLGVLGAVTATILTVTLMVVLAIGPIRSRLPAAWWPILGKAALWPLAAAVATGVLIHAAGLSSWLGAPLTLAVFAGAGLASGLIGRDQLRSFAR